MKLLGEYRKNYNRHGILPIPAKWILDRTEELYSITYFDGIEQAFYLRVFLNRSDLESMGQEIEENSDYEILRYSRHRLIANTNCIRLPKMFMEKGEGAAKKNWVCLGMINSFEVWYESDYERMIEDADKWMDLLDEIEF